MKPPSTFELLHQSGCLVFPAIALWMVVGGYLPIVLIEHAIPLAVRAGGPYIVGLEFAVGYAAVMTGACRLVQFFLVKCSRWSFTRLMLGQLGIALFLVLLGGFRYN
ncbi:MAG: hypothetical protein V4662_14405 [Verrucomicrobiota bacterium]